jgi:hypothetical protein
VKLDREEVAAFDDKSNLNVRVSEVGRVPRGTQKIQSLLLIYFGLLSSANTLVY